MIPRPSRPGAAVATFTPMQTTTIATTRPFFIIPPILSVTPSSVCHLIVSIRALRRVKSELPCCFSTKVLRFSQTTPLPTSLADYLVQALDDTAKFLRRDPANPRAQPLGQERAPMTSVCVLLR